VKTSIKVDYNEFRGGNYSPISITVKDAEGAIIHCNHALFDDTQLTQEMYDPYFESHRQWEVPIEVCRKCHKFRRYNEQEWEL